jgi:hypothetical protein
MYEETGLCWSFKDQTSTKYYDNGLRTDEDNPKLGKEWNCEIFNILVTYPLYLQERPVVFTAQICSILAQW